MNIQRIGLATAVVAMSSLTACSTWSSMTDSMTGGGTVSGTAPGSTESSGAGGMAGTGGTRTNPRGPIPNGAYGSMGTAGATGAADATGTAGATGTAAMSGSTVPGTEVSRMRGPTAPPTGRSGMPTFRNYNECRTWLSQQGREVNRGAGLGGELSTDPCRDVPQS